MDYSVKYLKYKNKYLKLKNNYLQYGKGDRSDNKLPEGLEMPPLIRDDAVGRIADGRFGLPFEPVFPPFHPQDDNRLPEGLEIPPLIRDDAVGRIADGRDKNLYVPPVPPFHPQDDNQSGGAQPNDDDGIPEPLPPLDFLPLLPPPLQRQNAVNRDPEERNRMNVQQNLVKLKDEKDRLLRNGSVNQDEIDKLDKDILEHEKYFRQFEGPT